jgi:hypothetical protein
MSTESMNRYTTTVLPLIGVTVLVILAALFTSGVVQVAAVIALVLLIVALGIVIGGEVTKQRGAVRR